MNHTNRGVNRLVLGVLGAVLIGIGALLVLASSSQQGADAWKSVGTDVERWAEGAWEATKIAGSTLAWVAVGFVAVLALLVILLITIIVRSIRSRRTALRAAHTTNDLGRIAITENFASEALTQALDARGEVLSAKVSATEVRGTPVVHVSVTPRQNTSPAEVARTVDGLLDNLATLSGRDTEAYVSIHAGLRAALAGDQSRVN